MIGKNFLRTWLLVYIFFYFLIFCFGFEVVGLKESVVLCVLIVIVLYWEILEETKSRESQYIKIAERQQELLSHQQQIMQGIVISLDAIKLEVKKRELD